MTDQPRRILEQSASDPVVPVLQSVLYDLIDLTLQGKQAHWNVVGPRFRSVHLELDEIVATTREGSDDVAERMATLGFSPDGQASGIEKSSGIERFPEGFVSVEEAVTAYSDRLATVVSHLREGIAAVGEHDPVSEDLLIGISAALEKHLWMLQSQED